LNYGTGERNEDTFIGEVAIDIDEPVSGQKPHAFFDIEIRDVPVWQEHEQFVFDREEHAVLAIKSIFLAEQFAVGQDHWQSANGMDLRQFRVLSITQVVLDKAARQGARHFPAVGQWQVEFDMVLDQEAQRGLIVQGEQGHGRRRGNGFAIAGVDHCGRQKVQPFWLAQSEFGHLACEIAHRRRRRLG